MIKIGNTYIFFCLHGNDDNLADYSGEEFTVTHKNETRSEFGGLYEGEFNDGSEYSVYADELFDSRNQLTEFINKKIKIKQNT